MSYRVWAVCVFGLTMITPYHLWSLTAAALGAAALTPIITKGMNRRKSRLQIYKEAQA